MVKCRRYNSEGLWLSPTPGSALAVGFGHTPLFLFIFSSLPPSTSRGLLVHAAACARILQIPYQQFHFPPLYYSFSPHQRTCLLILGREGSERETSMWEGNIDWLPLTCAPTGTKPHNLGICPDQKSHLWSFSSQDDVLTNRVSPARALTSYFIINNGKGGRELLSALYHLWSWIYAKSDVKQTIQKAFNARN